MTKEILGFVTVKDYEFPNTFYCWAILSSLDVVKKDSFVIIEDAKNPSMKFIGQVIDIVNASTILKESSREEMLRSSKGAEDIVKGALSEPAFFKVYAKIKLMYKIEENDMHSVDVPPTDTSPVVRSELRYHLPQILGFSQNPKTSICLGTLYSHPDVHVCLDLNRMLSGHIAIFGQTHSGKSYAAGVIIEEVVEKGVPVLVFDHMGEYLSMDKTVDGRPGLNLIIVRPGIDITIDFDDLIKASPILTTLGITDAQLNLLKDAYTEAQIQIQKEAARKGTQVQKAFRGVDAIQWLLSDVRIPKTNETRKMLYVIGRRKGYSTATIDGLRWKLEVLLNKGIIGAGFDIIDIIKPRCLTVVDLSTVDQSLRSLVVAAMLSKIAEARKKDKIPPLLVVIEEAHNYVPPEETPSSVMIRDLIRGARHWGIGVMLVSQRPSGIHRDAINVANTHIIFRLKGTDLEYVKQFAPFTKEELEDIQILPDGVAYITGPIIRGGLSIKVAIRKRRTVHGGQSIKFLNI